MYRENKRELEPYAKEKENLENRCISTPKNLKRVSKFIFDWGLDELLLIYPLHKIDFENPANYAFLALIFSYLTARNIVRIIEPKLKDSYTKKF